MFKLQSMRVWEPEPVLSEAEEGAQAAAVAELDEPLPQGVAGQADILSIQQWIDMNA
jgi:hypothetical protein